MNEQLCFACHALQASLRDALLAAGLPDEAVDARLLEQRPQTDRPISHRSIDRSSNRAPSRWWQPDGWISLGAS